MTTVPANTGEQQLRDFYRALAQAWGPQHWWPAQSRFEVVAGAYLTQNTAWTNVEHALANLRRAGVLSLEGIRNTPMAELEQLIRPAGYFRQKAQRVKTFVTYVFSRYNGSLDRMFARPTAELRQELLTLTGVGPETADSILLYAGGHPVFVVDAYTRRILERHGILPASADYEQIRELFERALRDLPPIGRVSSLPLAPLPGASHMPSRMSQARRSGTAQVFAEMHALIVGVGKNHCSKQGPDCEHCPLARFLPHPSHSI